MTRSFYIRSFCALSAWLFAHSWCAQVSPDVYEGLELWLKSDVGVTLSGSSVLLWDDQSGNGNNASVFAGSLRPTLVNNVLNGFPVVRFDGWNDFLDFPEINNIRTVFWVIKEDETANTVYPRCLLGHSTEKDFLRGPNKLIWHPTLSALEVRNGVTRVNFQQVDGVQTLVPSNYSIISVATTGDVSASSLVIDRLLYERVWDGDLLEIAIFSEALTPEEVEQVELYLADRYGPEFYVSDDVNVLEGFCPVEICAAPGFSSYQWSDGSASECISVNNSGAYSVTVQDLFGRIKQDTIMVSFPGNTNPSDTLICLGDEFVWNVELDPLVYDIVWTGGIEGATFSTMEEGQVDLSIQDENACILIVSFQLEVDSFPILVSLGPDVELCAGNVIGITTDSEVPLFYLWNNGSLENVLPIEESSTYSLEATNANGCVAGDSIDVIVVGVAPSISFNATSFCHTSTTEFTSVNLSESDIVSWSWDFGDGNLGTGELAGHPYDTPGAYEVSVIAVSAEGCSNIYSSSIYIHALPEVSYFLPLPCENEYFELESGASSTDGEIISWQWQLDDISTNGEMVSFLPQSAGFHDVSHTVFTEWGCESTYSATFQVLNAPVANFLFDGVCVGSLTAFSEDVEENGSGEIEIFAWQFGDGTGSFLPQPFHFYTGQGEYEVQLIAASDNGCKDTIIQVVEMRPPPQIDFNTGNACLGVPYPLMAQVENDYIVSSYQWFVEGQQASTDALWYSSFSETGLFEVSLEVVTSEGCFSSIAQSIPVWPAPESFFSFDPDMGAPPLAVQFNSDGSSVGAQEWFFGDGGSLSGEDPEYIFSQTGSFEISMILTNAFGCSDTSFATILVDTPVLDIVIEQVGCTDDGRPYVLLVNNGNFAVRHLKLSWQLGGDSPVSEWWDGMLLPNQSLLYEFQSGFNVLPSNQNYLCIELEAFNTDFAEVNTSDNVFCKNLVDNLFELFPPFYSSMTGLMSIRFAIPDGGDVALDVFSMNGSRVSRTEMINLSEGIHTYKIDTGSITPGVYMIRLSWNDRSTSKLFFVSIT